MHICTAVSSACCVLKVYSGPMCLCVYILTGNLLSGCELRCPIVLQVLRRNQYTSRTQERGDGVLRGRVGHGRF